MFIILLSHTFSPPSIHEDIYIVILRNIQSLQRRTETWRWFISRLYIHEKAYEDKSLSSFMYTSLSA